MYSAELRVAILEWLDRNVPRPRMRHILGVEETARAWAALYGLDETRAAWAGLTHDLAKYFPGDRILALARAEGLQIDPICEENPHLLHAEVGAIVARDRFGIEDEEILAAIRNHTLGQPGMSALDCVVFVADALEPSRGRSKRLQTLRQSVETHLYRGLVAVCEASIRHLLENEKPIHPRTQQTRDWFLHRVAESPLPIHQETLV